MKNRLRPCEMLMAVVACLSFLWVAGQWAVVSVPLTVAIVASWFVPNRYSTTPSRQRQVFSVIGIPFLFLGLYNFTLGGIQGFQRIAVLGAVYVLTGAAVELYRRPEEARPAVFHAGVVTVMLVGGLTRANPYYLYCLFLYTLGLVGLLERPVSGMIGGPRRVENKAPRLVLFAGLLVALPIAFYLNSLMPRVSRALYDSYATSLIGVRETFLYGISSDLSTIQDLRGSDEISMRLFGPPTFLRGQVLYSFDGNSWSGIKARDEREIMTSQTGRFTLGNSEQALQTWRIEPVKLFSGPLSVPPGAVEVVASVEELEVDPFDGLSADNDKPYQVRATGTPGGGLSERRAEFESERWREYYLQLPDELRQPLGEKARSIVGADSLDHRETAFRIQEFLTGNGRYEPGATHSRRDPILHFLGEGKLAGHCEYFATSMTLMLRSLDIPARYVVGYVTAEKSPLGYFIVRDRDAHAWVEVYLDGQWQAFDPTPAAELRESHPEGFKTPAFEALWDYFRHLSSGFWRWISGLEGSSLERRLMLGFVLVLSAGIVAAGYRFRHSIFLFRRPNEEKEPMQALGQEFFAKLAGKGLEKRKSETPLEFSERVRTEVGTQAADWLDAYAVLRYRGYEKSDYEELVSHRERLQL